MPLRVIVEFVDDPVSVIVPPECVKFPLTFKLPVPALEAYELILSIPEFIITLPFTINVMLSQYSVKVKLALVPVFVRSKFPFTVNVLE